MTTKTKLTDRQLAALREIIDGPRYWDELVRLGHLTQTVQQLLAKGLIVPLPDDRGWNRFSATDAGLESDS